MATNIKDVAKLAKVAITTVSRYYNYPSKVKASTRLIIEQAIAELEFVPNAAARSIKTNQTKTIAIIVPTILVSFYAKFVHYLQEACDGLGYNTLLCNSNEKRERELYFISLFKNQQVDGIIAFTYSSIDDYVKKGFPIVTFDRTFTGSIATVTSDNYQGGKLAASRFIDLGLKNVAYLGTKKNLEGTDLGKRREGFIDALAHEGIKGIEYLKQDPILDYSLLINSFLNENPEIQGVFCETDFLAENFVKIALSRGIKIPEQIKVIGVDGVDDQFYGLKTLTTVVQSLPVMSATMVQMLVKQINQKATPEQVIVPVYLRLGETA
jgi:LacI family transcriptional regulator